MVFWYCYRLNEGVVAGKNIIISKNRRFKEGCGVNDKYFRGFAFKKHIKKWLLRNLKIYSQITLN